jgi:hypothetical protein
MAPIVVITLTSSCAVFRAESSERAVELGSANRPAGSREKPRAQRKPENPRKVGDFFVHRFSGTAFDTPLVLTEEVVAQEDSVWIIDYALSEGERTTKLRVRLDAESDRPLRVTSLDGGVESELPTSSYDALLERTAFAADVNEGLIDASTGTCVVGPDELDCETKNFRVWIGDEPARLSVTGSKRFIGRDISGEISASDGTVIYRSELIEAGNAAPSKSSLASSN